MQLNITLQDLYYFDIYLRELLIEPPVNSLRSSGSSSDKPEGFQLKYIVSIKENDREIVFEILLEITKNKLEPLQIHALKFESNVEKETFMEMLISRITEAERKTIEKPMTPFVYEAHISTGHYPIKSTIEFGKYTLSPLDERTEKGWMCKLKFPVDAINKDDSLTWANVEVRHIVAFLSIIFDKRIRFENFSEISKDATPVINFEEIIRPDLRPVKHLFARELKVPKDFLELWNNFETLPQDVKASFMSSCNCYYIAKDMFMTNMGIASLLFVTAIEVISKKVIEKGTYGYRFKEFICKSVGRSDDKFRNQLGRFYGNRSEILHVQGVGLGYMPIGGIINFQAVSGNDLWRLDIYVNAALIGFLKNPDIFQ